MKKLLKITKEGHIYATGSKLTQNPLYIAPLSLHEK